MKRKRLLSWVLTFAMIAGMFVAPVSAEGNTTTISGDGTADKTGTMTITLEIPWKTPAASDLTYTAPTDLVYSGSDKTVTVAAASGVTGLGNITVKYYSDVARTTEATPKNVGTYYVGATVAEGNNYTASSGVLYGDGWTFDITKSTPSAPAAPTKASASKNTVTLTVPSDGYEYQFKCGDGSWQDSAVFIGLSPTTEYTFYQRIKETTNNNVSPSSAATSISTEADTYAMTITLEVPKKTPAATDLAYTAPSDLVYSGSSKTATVAAASGVTGIGDITVKYYSDAARTTEVTEARNVGTYYVGATVAGGDNYNASTGVLYGDGWTFTITVSTPDAPDAPTKASATKNSITLTAVDGCEYSKDGTTWQSGTEFTGLLPNTSYTFYQRIKATANTNASAASAGASFSTELDTYAMKITLVIVDKDTQTITASNVTATYGDTNAKVSATTNGNGAISYAVKSGSDVVDVNSSTGALNIKKAGTATITVTAASTSTGGLSGKGYKAATKDVTVTVNTKEMTVSASGYAGYYDQAAHGITVTVTDPASGYTVEYGETQGTYNLTASPTLTEAGTKTVYYQVTAANYTTYTGSATISINDKQPQTITASNVTITYGETDKSVSASTNGNGAISYAVKSGDSVTVNATTGALTIVKAGTATVTVTAAETSTYQQATKDVTVTVNKATPTAAAPSATATYGQTLADVTLTNPTGNTAGAWAWAVASTTSVGNVGTNTFKANFTPTDTGNYNSVSNVDVTVTVAKANPTAAAPSATATYGQTLADVTLTNPTGNTAGTWTWVDAATTSVGNAGSKTFKANFTPTDSENYNGVTNVDVSLTVNKVNATVTAAPTAKTGLTFNGGNQTLITTGTASGGTMRYALGTESAAEGSYSESIPEGRAAKTYYVWYKVVGDENHNDSTEARISVVIGQTSLGAQGVTIYAIPDQNSTGSQLTPKPVVKHLGYLLVEGEDYTLSYGENKDVGTGTGSVTVTGKGGYNGTLTKTFNIILPAYNGVLTVTAPSPYTYGDTLGTAPTVNSTGSLSGERVTVYYATTPSGTGTAWSSSARLNAGTYYVWAEIAKTATHDAATSERVQFTVNKATPTAPSGVLRASYTDTYKVTLNIPGGKTYADYEYSTDGSTWTALPALKDRAFTPTGLSSGTDYTIYLRTKADSNNNASAAATATLKTPAKVLLNYDANGSTAAVPGAAEYDSGATATAAEGIVRAGYTFAGWNTVENGGTHYEAGAAFSITANTTLYAQWTPISYNVIYNANGGSGFANVTGQAYNAEITLPTPTRAGYTFNGWATDEGGSPIYAGGQRVTGLTSADGKTVTLYAVWTENTYTVSGKVAEQAEGTDEKYNAAGVTVEIKRGNVTFDTKATGGDGSYQFTGVPAGIYNVVATRKVDGVDQTMTALVEVKSGDATVETIVLPPTKVNSVLNVEGDGTPPVMVGGLEKVAADNAEEQKEVTVTMTVKKQDESSADDNTKKEIAEIKQAVAASAAADSGSTEMDFLAVTVRKEIKDSGSGVTEEPITKTSQVMEIIVPYNMTGRFGFSISRYHDGRAEMFRFRSARLSGDGMVDGCFFADKAAGLIYIYASRFSTYAIGSQEGVGYALTVNGEDIGEYAPGDVVTVTADPAAEGKEFSHWEGNVTFDDANSPTTTFTMPNGAVTVTAKYKDAYTPPPSAPVERGGSRDSGGRDRSSGDSSVSYPHTVNEPDHGTVRVTPTAAVGSSKVTINARPDSGYTVDTVTVTDAKGQSVSVTKVNDTTYTFSQPESKVDIVVTFRQTAAPAPVEDVFDSFKDLDKDAWYREGVKYVLENGIMSGMGDGSFAPNGSTTRGMMAQILWNMEGRPAVDYDMRYADVDDNAWYCEAVRWATAEGVMIGYSDDSFGPEDLVTREQLAAILYRCAQRKGLDVSIVEDTDLLRYDDASDVSEWAVPAVQWTTGTGLMTGRTASTLNPRDTATRAEIATIIMRSQTAIE